MRLVHHPEALVRSNRLEAHLHDPDLGIFERTHLGSPRRGGRGRAGSPKAKRADYGCGGISRPRLLQPRG